MQGIQPVLIVTVTKVEAQAVLKIFSKAAGKKWKTQARGNKTYYDLGVHGDVPVFMVQSEMGIATPGGALITVTQAIQVLKPQAIVMCGIAFGLRPDKQKLGDILVSKQIQSYEPQKIDVRKKRIQRGDRATASERLLDRLRSGDMNWHGDANIYFGLILSGEKLVDNPLFRKSLLKIEPEAIGGEMEGAGLYAAARDSKSKVDWILVKAICDWADGTKNDDAQNLAADNAAEFVLHVLRQGGLAEAEQSRLDDESKSQHSSLNKPEPVMSQVASSTVTYTVFISSPGDVLKERQIAYNVIEKVNDNLRTMKDLIGVRIILDSLTWEKNIFPNAGPPQNTIKAQIPYDQCDIFIGIFWKRFGTPPGTVRPQDGKPYLSGTQQEIEETMAHRDKTGSPVIMLYRKDEPISALQSKEEIEQLHCVVDFFRECEGGTHPALVIPFKDETFGEMLSDHLLKAVVNLYQSVLAEKPHEVSPKPDLTRTEPHHNGTTNEKADKLRKWLHDVKLREDPFRYQKAEYDSELLKYFAHSKQIRALTKAEVLQSHDPWIFFGRLGTGKTALRKLMASWGNLADSKNTILCLEFGTDDIQEILAGIDRVGDFACRFLQFVYRQVADRQRLLELPPFEWQPTSDLPGSLANLLEALQACRLRRVICLLDPDADSLVCKDLPVPTTALIEQLLKLPSAPGIGFCYFMPSEIKQQLDDKFPAWLKRLHLIQIQWSIEDLLELIKRRMIACSKDQAAPYHSLGEICDDDRDFASLVDRRIVSLAEGSPRGVVSLANHLIELHVQDYAQHLHISPKIWDEVEMDWWWQRRSRILGIPEHSFWVKDDQIFYGNGKLILSDTTQRLLSCLIENQENFATKENLKQAGWPGASSQGVSDAALREALRRMRDELEKEFADNNLGTPPLLKSVHGRGYRLYAGPAMREEKK